jgi:hypothetical protein
LHDQLAGGAISDDEPHLVDGQQDRQAFGPLRSNDVIEPR